MTLCKDICDEASAISSSTSRLNVLLVDEDHSDCALFGIAVDKSNLDIWLQTVPDGGRAVDYLEGRGDFSDRALHPVPDLVVLDLDMRLTGGLEFLEWRRATPVCSSLPVVLFSGFAYKGAIETALAMGATTFIAKPQQLEGWVRVMGDIWELALRHLQHAESGD
ncbi:MAG: response regulator [Candidatus Dormibacteraceae bacterium]